MKKSIGIEKRVLHRDARAARLAAAGASGLASPPLATFSALPMTIFWLRQIMPHTLRNIVMPKSMPVRIAVPPAPDRYRSVFSPSPWMPTSSTPKRNVSSAA